MSNLFVFKLTENRDQFTLDDPSESSTYNQPYDYMSIMHYDANAFSANGQQTMIAKQPQYTEIMGTGQDLTITDIRKINLLYKCAAGNNAGIVQPTVNPFMPTQGQGGWGWVQTVKPIVNVINPYQPAVVQPIWPFSNNNQVTNVQQSNIASQSLTRANL